MKKLVNVTPGELYAIPLFLSDQSVLKRFSKKDFDRPDASFVFMRVVEDRGSAGIIIEVLDVVGQLDTAVEHIVNAPRLFRPIVVSGLEIYKKRWPRVGHQRSYDAEEHSHYSGITLVISPTDNPILWRGGTKTPIPLVEAQAHEPWTMWSARQVEDRVKTALSSRGQVV